MLLVPLPRYRRHRGRLKPPVAVPPPAPPGLVLVAATYKDTESVRLTFDRAVAVAGLDAGQVVVSDEADGGRTFRGVGPGTPAGPGVVVIGLAEDGPATGTGIRLTAGAGTGIVAAGDGGTWPGVTDLLLPFP